MSPQEQEEWNRFFQELDDYSDSFEYEEKSDDEDEISYHTNPSAEASFVTHDSVEGQAHPLRSHRQAQDMIIQPIRPDTSMRRAVTGERRERQPDNGRGWTLFPWRNPLRSLLGGSERIRPLSEEGEERRPQIGQRNLTRDNSTPLGYTEDEETFYTF